MPPAVGSGCRQTSVAAGARPLGSASWPTRFRPSAVCSVIGSRPAGSTVLAVILLMPASPVCRRPGTAAAWPPLPARIVPVPALGRTRGLFRPDHHVRRSRDDLLVTARAAVRLGGRGAGNPADHPDAVRPLLLLRRPQPGRRLGPVAPWLRAGGRPRRTPAAAPRPGRQLSGAAAGLA